VACPAEEAYTPQCAPSGAVDGNPVAAVTTSGQSAGMVTAAVDERVLPGGLLLRTSRPGDLAQIGALLPPLSADLLTYYLPY
jgi:hypothetical protein